MRVVVTGATGMLGRDVVSSATARGHDVTALSRADLDITDLAATTVALAQAGGDVVINCAAWTDVDGAESQEAAAFAVNATGAGNVASAAALAGAAVVHVSTDYVFDGSKSTPYLESDATAPIGAYGRTKLAGELAVAAIGERHAIVRTAWLFGLGGSNFVETMLRLGGERDEVSVVGDQIGCPTWTLDLAEALISVAERGTSGVLHAAGSDPCSWFEFASEIFDRAEIDCDLKETTTKAFPRPAQRPAWSVLGSQRQDGITLGSWRESLGQYLVQRQKTQTNTTNGAQR
ncbi:MAG: dTDP-4-dehydrorhamnose reductase [Actinomycetota bacterium]